MTTLGFSIGSNTIKYLKKVFTSKLFLDLQRSAIDQDSLSDVIRTSIVHIIENPPTKKQLQHYQAHTLTVESFDLFLKNISGNGGSRK